MKQTFKLNAQLKQDMTGLIKQYFLQERNEDLGDLAAALILDFFMEELAPKFYNLGVEDAHTYMSEKLEDIFEIQK
ncbi:DUF2164 domain-containing protein [Sediminibacillus albus]|uniref:Uncharacterized conserved protein, DUF2164 family n=1 Tax=Sediminibacillus albus TaxID=407036 RepID=A0A1G9B7B6_9BACI|nr:DUF2164 domain-containing protein [Sediminibacillus albus]SDK35436.1 Uncharacterized conserved protein, DUF2164 family [Sediminibacillus albus]